MAGSDPVRTTRWRTAWLAPVAWLASCAGDVDVRVSIDPELRSLVEVVSIDSSRPGDPNAVDVRVELAARTGRPVHAWFDADWFDERGNGYGGQAGQVHAAPDALGRLHLGTMSAAASRLELRITDSPPPRVQRHAPEAPAPLDIPRDVNRVVRTPLSGTLDGRAFDARAVVFVHDERDDRWRVEVWDRPLARLEDLGLDDPSRKRVILELEAAPRQGATTSRLLQPGGARVELPGTAGAAERKTRSPANAWVLATESWETAGRGAGGDRQRQQVGSATGRLNVCFEATAGFAASCLAGVFEDAPIVEVRGSHRAP